MSSVLPCCLVPRDMRLSALHPFLITCAQSPTHSPCAPCSVGSPGRGSPWSSLSWSPVTSVSWDRGLQCPRPCSVLLGPDYWGKSFPVVAVFSALPGPVMCVRTARLRFYRNYCTRIEISVFPIFRLSDILWEWPENCHLYTVVFCLDNATEQRMTWKNIKIHGSRVNIYPSLVNVMLKPLVQFTWKENQFLLPLIFLLLLLIK